MATALGTFINEIAERAGVKPDDAGLKTLLASLPPNLSVTIPDEISNAVSQNLFTLESAKSNATLRNYFAPQILNAPDSVINELIESFDDATKAEFKAEKSTPTKIKKLAEKIEAKYKALNEELKKGNGSEKSNERIEKLTGEIEKLNADLLAKDKDWEGKLKAAQDEAANKSFTFAKRMALATKQYADEKKGELNIEFADLVLQKELAAKKAKLELNQDGTFKLVQLENPDLPYMENHKNVSFGDFLDRTLANHNMLKVSAPNKPEPASPFKPAEGKEIIPQSVRESIAQNLDSQIAILSNGHS